jgi:hypothetical protein
MENGEIEDSQITSSSSESDRTEASNGRLNGISAWIPSPLDNNRWIQVCFNESVVFTAISTQGFGPFSYAVSSYAVSYSFDNETFQNYIVNGIQKVR